jgi:flagellin
LGKNTFKEEPTMGMTVNTNVSAINAYQNLEANQMSESHYLEQLSSGFRINSASDDAAGFVISQDLAGQVSGYQQATANAQDGISLVQVAEGALNETTSILQRIRTLSVEAANATTDSTGLTAIKSEIDQSVQELDNIAATTKYGTLSLFGSGATQAMFTFQVGAYAGQVIAVQVSGADSAALGVSNLDSFFSIVSATNFSFSSAMISTIDAAINLVSGLEGQLGAYQNELQHAINNLNVGTQNLSAAESTIRDTDMAATYSNYTKEQILVQTSTSMLAQANAMPQAVLRLIQ